MVVYFILWHFVYSFIDPFCFQQYVQPLLKFNTINGYLFFAVISQSGLRGHGARYENSVGASFLFVGGARMNELI